MPICIYDSRATDFSTNGLGLLTPSSCTVSGEGGGMIELELIQPIDETLRWAQLQEGCIIKAPVPTRESPLYEEIEDVYDTVPVSVQREIWKVYNTSVGVYMRAGPGTGYKKYGYLKNGAEVVVLEKTNASWYHVCVVKGGRVCYMSTKYLTYARSETEVIQEGQIIGQRIVEYAQSQDQLFRIYSVERDSKARVVKAKAMHIFYDQRANIVNGKYDPENVPLNTALQEMYSKLMYDSGFTLHIATGLDTEITGSYGYKNPVENLLDPDEGMLKQANVILERDNFDMYIIPNTTRDSGVTIRRGKNLRALTVTYDISNVTTRIIPCGKNKNGEELFLDGDGYVDSPDIGNYPFPYVQKIDYDAQTASSKSEADGKTSFASDAATRVQLKKLAEEDFSINGVDKPTYGMKVDFVLLQNTAEYANYAALQAVYLHDTVTVIDSVIGTTAKVGVSAYVWNCLTKQYNSISLGDVSSLEQVVYSYSLPTGGISGTKIAPGTASGEILREASIQYAKIAVAAIQQLSANSITAITAKIQEIVSGSMTTDALYAGIADIIALNVETALTASDIRADRLASALADFAVLTAGSAEFDQATIKHLLAEVFNLDLGQIGSVFIENLIVRGAQVLSATVSNLVIKASDGNYYELDVDDKGCLIPAKVTIDEDEIKAGMTNDGDRVILETHIVAEDLTSTNIFGTIAVIDQINTERLDADYLFADEAFISLLRTVKIASDTSLDVVIGRQNEMNRWFTFDNENGFSICKPAWTDANGVEHAASIWQFIAKETGIQIRRKDMPLNPILQAERNRIATPSIQVGKTLIKGTSTGGIVVQCNTD